MGDKVGAQRLRRKANALGMLKLRQQHPAKRVQLREVPGDRETEIRLPSHILHCDVEEPCVKLKLRYPSWVSCTTHSTLGHVFDM